MKLIIPLDNHSCINRKSKYNLLTYELFISSHYKLNIPITMIIRNEFYDGVLYQIEYRSELSQFNYTKKFVYYIKTEDENYPHAHKAIESIMSNGSWREGEYIMKNKQQPSMANTFHTYHKFSYDEELDVYVYTYIMPYDD